MGNFTVEFAEIVRNPPVYETYSVQLTLPCTELESQEKKLDFDNTSTDFNIGANYSGDTPAKLRILSFTDTMTHTELGTGIVTVPTGFESDKLMDNSTSLELTYPCEIDMSEIGNIHTFNDASHIVYEFYCSDTTKIEARRIRTIEYTITDVNGLEGPIKKAYNIITEL